MTNADADERPEDWDAKGYDGLLFGGIAFAATCAIFFAGHNARAHTPWILTAWVMALIWVGLMHVLTNSAYRLRRWKDGRRK